MRIDTGQMMRMQQQMKLSPRMIQSMEILQLPTLALEERIEQELEANPTLEMQEVRPDEDEARQDPDQKESDQPDGEREMQVGDDAGHADRDDFNRLGDISDDYDTWDQNTTGSATFRGARETGERDAKMDAMANTAAPEACLTEQLADQFRFVEADDALRRAAEHVVTFIDDDGYLRTDPEEIERLAPSGVTVGHISQAIELIQQSVDPPGIGARDVRECLLLQLDAEQRDGLVEDHDTWRIARALVSDHLKDIEMNRLPKIARTLGQDMDDVKAGLAHLRRLDPRPGRQLVPARNEAIVPDVIVEYDPMEDRYVAALNRGRQPGLRVSPLYTRMSKDREQAKETREFLKENMRNASWLIDAIEQRNNTLLRVVNVVLSAQREFFDHGPQHLRPLPMIQVADQLGIHVGTVSRAVNGKYMQTPRGVYPLRMFFSGGTESSDGEEMSWQAVQAKLKEIIDNEDKARPWSDDKLVEELKKHGIEIARRTVAKYRGQMNIPPARQRKEY